jgi:long-chain fatty acid transport protein
MSITVRKATAALLATGLFAFSGAAMATNGYFTHGVGTESKGMAGSGVGSPENLGGIAAATNPALGVFADEKWQVGIAIFSPMRSYTASDSVIQGQGGAFTLSAGEYDSDNEAFPIPYIAKNWVFDSGMAMSFVFYGRGGMNTEWNGDQRAFFDPTGMGGSPPPGGIPGLYGGGLFGAEFTTAGVDLLQAFSSLNFAWKVSDKLAVGFGPVVAIQMFEATGLPVFGSYSQTFADAFLQNGMGAPVTSLTNNGHDMSTGYGFSVGLWGGSESFSYGLAYQSTLSMSDFDDYSDLYAESGGFDIPSTIKGGISFAVGDAARINLDVERVGYSDVDSVHNSISNLFTGCFIVNPSVAPETSGCLGGPNGAGFGWQDVTVYKAGLSYRSSERNTWRMGFSYGEQPIPSSEVLFNILAPGVMETHLTVGLTSERPSGNVMSWSLMYAPKKTVTGTSAFDPTQSIKLEMTQLELEFAYRF